MNNKDNERITYEEFMLVFRNAPRLVYILYDKAEDEIDRLNNIINELENKLKNVCINCYEDKEVARIEKWIKELKNNSNLPTN